MFISAVESSVKGFRGLVYRVLRVRTSARSMRIAIVLVCVWTRILVSRSLAVSEIVMVAPGHVVCNVFLLCWI